MGLGGEIYDCIYVMTANDRFDGFTVTDISQNEMVTRVFLDRQQVFQITGVSELVKDDDLITVIFG
jgi:hypothetical protein